MPEIVHQTRKNGGNLKLGSCKFLRQDQIAMIDEALTQVGTYGEVRLVIEKGRLRFVVIQKSMDALKWQADQVE
jgi:hypothetical protein